MSEIEILKSELLEKFEILDVEMGPYGNDLENMGFFVSRLNKYVKDLAYAGD